MAHSFTFSDLKLIVQDAFLEYTSVDYNETINALEGKIHRTVSDLGMDSLDILEVIMTVEDELEIYFDDSYLERNNCNPSMLVEGFAEFLARAPSTTY